MIIRKTLLATTLGIASLLISTLSLADEQSTVELKPLRVSLSDVAEQYHQQQEQARRNNPSKLARIQYYLLQEKGSLPKALSQQLTLQKISHNEKQALHHYRLPNYQSQEKLNPSITRLTRMLALKNLCLENPNSKALLEGNIEFVLQINDKNDAQLLQETMRVSDCSNI